MVNKYIYLSKLLSNKKLDNYTCILRARSAIKENKDINYIVDILKVDADKIRSISKKLYNFINEY